MIQDRGSATVGDLVLMNVSAGLETSPRYAARAAALRNGWASLILCTLAAELLVPLRHIM